jgi:hypothetical protein
MMLDDHERQNSGLRDDDDGEGEPLPEAEAEAEDFTEES